MLPQIKTDETDLQENSLSYLSHLFISVATLFLRVSDKLKHIGHFNRS